MAKVKLYTLLRLGSGLARLAPPIALAAVLVLACAHKLRSRK